MPFTNTTLLVVGLAIMLILIIICFIVVAMNASKISTLMSYSEDGDLEGALKDYYEKVKDLTETVNKTSDAVLLSRLANCENETNISIKKTGLVNFNAFDDVKGNMSFSLALLNSNNDGFILTSLYGHNSCNTYIREVTEGETAVKLLAEEKEALEKAKNTLKRADN